MDVGAVISWNTLPGSRRQELLEKFEGLTSCPSDQWPKEEVVSLNLVRAVYLLRASDGLRVFFHRETDGRITILDIALQEMLERYFTPKPEVSSAT